MPYTGGGKTGIEKNFPEPSIFSSVKRALMTGTVENEMCYVNCTGIRNYCHLTPFYNSETAQIYLGPHANKCKAADPTCLFINRAMSPLQGFVVSQLEGIRQETSFGWAVTVACSPPTQVSWLSQANWPPGGVYRPSQGHLQSASKQPSFPRSRKGSVQV